MTTNAAVVIDTTKNEAIMVVAPTQSLELDDPSFNPPNSMQVLVPLDTHGIGSHHQLSEIIDKAFAKLNSLSPSKGGCV